MSMLSTLGRFAFILSVPAIVIACTVESTPAGGSSAGGGPVPSGSVSATPSSPDGGPSEYPILAVIDTNETGAPELQAPPGQGVGVFTEYTGAGSWHVWWTCDSLVDTTNPPCPFDVKVTVANGTISAPATQGFQATDSLKTSSTSLEAVTSTSTGTNGMTFVTAPGGVITLSATIGGQYDGRFLFFVEGGKLNDGFKGTVTDPIMFQGATP